MKQLLGLCSLFLFFNLAFSSHSAKAQGTVLSSPCHTRNYAFQDGEELVYVLYYNWNFVWMAAGEVTFRVKNEGDRYHVSAYGSTYPSYEWFYKVHDKYDSYLDKSTLLPLASVRSVSEGGYRLYDKLTFDRAAGKVTSLRGKTRESAAPETHSIDSCVHDLLSVIYMSRNLNFDAMRPGMAVPVKLFMDKKTWPLQLRYQGKAAGKRIHKLGKFNTILFSPDVIKGYVFKEDNKLKVWASDDDNHIPLLIESPISVGSVKAVLKSYRGLRYPLSSRIQSDSETADSELPH